VRGVGGGYRFVGNLRRLTLMDVITLFEEPTQAGNATTAPADATPVDRALDAVLSEIDQIAQATFKSITLSTMLRLIERQAAPTRASLPTPARA
jgi:DNA-binding IscR family transcriptional regulator